MLRLVAKTTSINLRVTPQFRNDLQALADYRGLTLSSLAHSLLVKAVRHEKQIEPEAFAESELKVNAIIEPPSRTLAARTQSSSRPRINAEELNRRKTGDSPHKKKTKRVA